MLAQPLRLNDYKMYWLSKIRCMGPGLLMAGAAIGVSHLIQSTRAGADYGFSLIGFIIVVNLLKYPFFEFGHRYAAATGESLLEGYQKLGKQYLILFLAVSLLTGIISIAGVTFVTAALLSLLTGTAFSHTQLSFICMLVSVCLICTGEYRWLDKTIKWIMLVLFITTVLAFAVAVYHGPVRPVDFQGASPWQVSSLPFLIALMGWMPAPIELSVWQSLWIQAKNESLGTPVTIEEAKLDFHVGYFMTILLAIIFLSLGALVMHGSGVSFANSGPAFAGQLVSMYTGVLGQWVWPIVTIAALLTMFSTTLTVIDAYPRAMASGLNLVFKKGHFSKLSHLIWTVLCCSGGLLIIYGFMHHFKQMIDFATTIAFVCAPLFAYLNFKLILSKHTPAKYQPGGWYKLLSIAGLLFLGGLLVLYGYLIVFKQSTF